MNFFLEKFIVLFSIAFLSIFYFLAKKNFGKEKKTPKLSDSIPQLIKKERKVKIPKR